jgi:hypothetical protein
MKELLGGLAIAIAVSFPAPLFFPAAEPIRPVSDWIAGNGGMAAMSRSARGSEGGIDVRMISCALAALAVVLGSGAAAAQSVNLTGKFVCVVHCRQGLQGNPAFITQNGEQIDLVNETGQPARAWPDWTAPASRIWVDAWEEGAVYSPDGMTLQFDDGTIWQRDLGPPPPPPVLIVPRRTRG